MDRELLVRNRLAIADIIFDEYEFNLEVEDTDSWLIEADELYRTVYIEDDEPVTFSIEFEKNSDKPIDVSANFGGELVGNTARELSRYVEMRKYRPTAGQSWFHGTKAKFDKFDSKFIGIGNDALGSGFYFTTDEETARGYAFDVAVDEGFLLEVKLSIQNPMDASAYIRHDQIKKIISASPNLDDMLWNFGDLGSTPKDVVLNKAASSYESMNSGDDALQLLNAMSNDFFNGDEALFLKAVTEATGYDGLYRIRGNEVHAVAWSPEQVQIVGVCPVQKMSFQP